MIKLNKMYKSIHYGAQFFTIKEINKLTVIISEDGNDRLINRYLLEQDIKDREIILYENQS